MKSENNTGIKQLSARVSGVEGSQASCQYYMSCVTLTISTTKYYGAIEHLTPIRSEISVGT